MRRLRRRGCSTLGGKLIEWNNSPPNFTNGFEKDIANWRHTSQPESFPSTARVRRAKSRRKFGQWFLPDSPRSLQVGNRRSAIRNPEMAFARTTALEFLRRAYEQNRLAHAYLISGPPGSGKEMLAAEVASLVNGTPAKEVFSAKAREIFIAGPESKSRRISIEQIRELEHTLQMRAANSRRKVAIISNADRLGDAAANAFLKTLEEPPSD